MLELRPLCFLHLMWCLKLFLYQKQVGNANRNRNGKSKYCLARQIVKSSSEEKTIEEMKECKRYILEKNSRKGKLWRDFEIFGEDMGVCKGCGGEKSERCGRVGKTMCLKIGVDKRCFASIERNETSGEKRQFIWQRSTSVFRGLIFCSCRWTSFNEVEIVGNWRHL